MNNNLIKHLHNIGKAQMMIKEILDLYIFETLSKHNEWWDSTDEIANDKLEEIRCTLNGMQYLLWEIQEAIGTQEEDE